MAGNTKTSSSVTVTVNNTVATPTPTNGLCSTTQNICTVGTLQDTTDSTTNYLWNCLGSNGGTTATCSLTKPPITPTPTNGLCGATQNICTQGTFSDVTDSSSQYLWQCLGSNGGTNTSCSLSIPTTPTTPTTPAPGTGTFTPTVTQKPISSGGGGGGGSSSTRPTTTAISQSNSQLAQLVELLIALGLIAPDKVSAARAFIASSQTTVTSTGTTKFTLALDIGARNSEVTALQTYLISQGFLSSKATGYFGPATAKAVGLFQQKYNIAQPGTPAYGFVGPKTRAKLNELVK